MNHNKYILIYLFIQLNTLQKLWGLGIGDWGLGIGPNPQSPIPNPQSPTKLIKLNIKYLMTNY